MKSIIKLGLILLLISTIAAIFLALTYNVTIDQIIFQRNAINENARKEVLADAEEFKPLNEDELNTIIITNPNIQEVYMGYKGDILVGYAIKSIGQGYGGPVEVITGIDFEGTIKGVRVGNHLETPGLGANAQNPSFYLQYNGKKTDAGINVVKNNPQENEIQALSGATITSRAVTNGVNYATEAFNMISK